MKVNREITTKIIKELGIPANLKGYHYLIYGIETLVSGTGRLNSMMKFYQSLLNMENFLLKKLKQKALKALNINIFMWVKM